MKAEPASPDQRVPSQSNTAIFGERERTRAWKSGVVRRRAVLLSDKGLPLGALAAGVILCEPRMEVGVANERSRFPKGMTERKAKAEEDRFRRERLVLAPVVVAEGGEVAPAGFVGGAAGLSACGVAHPDDALAKDEARPEGGRSVRRQDIHYERCNYEREEGDVEEFSWARVKDGAERFDLLIGPARGGDSVLETGVCEQGQGYAEDNRRNYCCDPEVGGRAVRMVDAYGVRGDLGEKAAGGDETTQDAESCSLFRGKVEDSPHGEIIGALWRGGDKMMGL